MHNIWKLVQENRVEAFNIIKAHGGRIDFVDDIIHGSTNDDEDDWLGCAGEENVPWCVVGGDEHIVDTAVLAVKCSERDGQVEFLAYDNELGEVFGWIPDACCCGNSENEVYEFIGTWEEKQ